MTATFFEQLVNQSCYYRCWGYWVTELTVSLRGTVEKNMMRRKWPLMDNTLQEAGGGGEWDKAGEWESHLTLTCHPYLSPSVSFFTFVPSLFPPPPLSPSPSFLLKSPLHSFDNTLVAQTVKNLPAMQETWVQKIPGRREWQLTLVVFIPLSTLFLLFQHLPSSSIFVFSNRNSWAF